MLARLKKYRELVLVLGAVLAAVLYWVASPSMSDAILYRAGGAKTLPMPVSLPMGQEEGFAIELDVSSGLGGDFTLDIHPDDCVTNLMVNGVDLPFRTYPGYCSWNTGFRLSKSEIQKHVGKDVSKFHIEIALRNTSGLGGMTVGILADSFLMSLFSVLFFLCLGGLIFSVGGRFKTNAVTIRADTFIISS